MAARIAAKFVLAWSLLWICAALVFFGIGLFGYAVTAALAPQLGLAGASAVAGAIFILPLLFVVLAVLALRPARRAPKPGTSEYLAAIFAGIAKETPWMAVAGTGIALVAELALKLRRKK